VEAVNILFVGFGSVGQALAPLLMAHWKLAPTQLRAIAADAEGAAVAEALGIIHEVNQLTPENLSVALGSYLRAGDILLNVSVNVSSRALIDWCQANGVGYLDTCVEPWEGGYDALLAVDPVNTTNYALREAALAGRSAGKPTAVIAHGANPGVISHLAKAGLLEMARQRGLSLPSGPQAWARLSQALGVRVIHIAERDCQRAAESFEGEFVNTWSVDGLLSEAKQYAECGWGTHERELPPTAVEHTAGCRVGIYLREHSAEVRMQSWVPSVGPQTAYLITHHEALSLADLLTVSDASSLEEAVAYRPTVYYAYTPCKDTQSSLDKWLSNGLEEPLKKRVLRDELIEGEDQLGVLFVFDGGAFWYGSTVELHEARAWTPYCNATALQVVGGILGALDWLRANPCEGVVEAEDLPHDEVLKVALPYLGKVEGFWTTWQPSIAPGVDSSASLQFSAFRV
jgi:homospermidine synthase